MLMLKLIVRATLLRRGIARIVLSVASHGIPRIEHFNAKPSKVPHVAGDDCKAMFNGGRRNHAVGRVERHSFKPPLQLGTALARRKNDQSSPQFANRYDAQMERLLILCVANFLRAASINKAQNHGFNWGWFFCIHASKSTRSFSIWETFHSRCLLATSIGAETILECDSHTQMHVTNTAAIVYNQAHYAKSRNSVPRGRPGRHHYAESAG
jgi:hypothetical protein